MGVSRRRAIPLVLALLAALLCVAVAAAMPARDPAGHPPMAASGPDGRRALDGTWTRARRRRAGATRPAAVLAQRDARSPARPASASYEGAWPTYRTTLRVPAAGDYAIRFESVNHRATVLARRPASSRVTPAPTCRSRRAPGSPRARHVLVVRADWRSPRADEGATAGTAAWFNFGGINREVTIRRLGASEVDAPAIATRLDGDGAAGRRA